jgi:hypothetical protein
VFVRKLAVTYLHAADVPDGESGELKCPVRWIDNFAMRNFTNDAIFDDTLPLADGLMGYRGPLDRLEAAMTEWFRRKSYLKAGQKLILREQS